MARLVSRFIKDILTDDQDNFDIVGVSMFAITLAFVAFGGFDLYALHQEYRLILAHLPANATIPPLPQFDLQGWGIGAAALMGGHGLSSLSGTGRGSSKDSQ